MRARLHYLVTASALQYKNKQLNRLINVEQNGNKLENDKSVKSSI